MSRKDQIIEFLKAQPEDAFLNYALATECIAEGKDAEAESIFEKLISNSPDYVATYYHMGKLLEKKGAVEEAKTVYQNGIDRAQKTGDRHSLSELQSALLDLEYGD